MSQIQFSCSVVSLWDTMDYSTPVSSLPCPSPTSRTCSNSRPSSWWCHPSILPSVILFSSCLQSFPTLRVFSNESVVLIRWPKYWSFSLSIHPSNEYLGLISFKTDWLDLTAVQGTLNNLLQCHSSKASVLRHSAFFIVQLSHPYMITGKTIALTMGPLWVMSAF